MNFVDKFNGNGTQTVFILTATPVSPQDVIAEFDGFERYYGQDFCLQTNAIIFIEKPKVGVDNVIVRYDGIPFE